MASSTPFLIVLIIATGQLLNCNVNANTEDIGCPFKCLPGGAKAACEDYTLDGPCFFEYKPICVKLENGTISTFPTSCVFCSEFKGTDSQVLHCCECTAEEEPGVQ